jgi:hypothetical protein
MPEIVLSFRDRRQQSTPLSTHLKFWVVRAFGEIS